MAETDAEGEALARLEAALDRIAQGGAWGGPLGIPPAQQNVPDTAAQGAVAARLDVLITQLRGALETEHAALTQGEGEAGGERAQGEED